jgi:hypothetical protein
MAYLAKNIDVQKFLAALDAKDREALYEHLCREAIERARYDQERKTLDYVRSMFQCSNYEKEEE